MKDDDSSELNEVLERILATGCVACNASKNLCDCIGHYENGKRCCTLCEHLA